MGAVFAYRHMRAPQQSLAAQYELVRTFGLGPQRARSLSRSSPLSRIGTLSAPTVTSDAINAG